MPIFAAPGASNAGTGISVVSAPTLERIDKRLDFALASVEKTSRRLGDTSLLIMVFILLNIAQFITMALRGRPQVSVPPSSLDQTNKNSIAPPTLSREKVRVIISLIAGAIILLTLAIFGVLAIWS